jgi:ankyrin repeat protein
MYQQILNMTAPVTNNTTVMTTTRGITISSTNSIVSNHSCHHRFGVFDDYLKHCHESCSRYSDWHRLLFACQQNKLDIVQQLIEEGGVDPSYSNPMKQSALHIAARYGHVECLEYLLQRIPYENRTQAVNSKNRLSGATPLHCCLQKNASGKNEKTKESDAAGKTPLDFLKESFEHAPRDDDVASHALLCDELRSKVTV